MCPYLEQGVCELGDPECTGRVSFGKCPAYSQERARLRYVTVHCPHASRRVHRVGRVKQTLDHTVWCHLPGREARVCHAWPADCPEHWRRRYEALAAQIGGEQRVGRCPRCGRVFLKRRSDAVCCSRSCTKLLCGWKQRRAAGRPVRKRMVDDGQVGEPAMSHRAPSSSVATAGR
jgi:uncharacterized C2H2 Zn-finger protein